MAPLAGTHRPRAALNRPRRERIFTLKDPLEALLSPPQLNTSGHMPQALGEALDTHTAPTRGGRRIFPLTLWVLSRGNTGMCP